MPAMTISLSSCGRALLGILLAGSIASPVFAQNALCVVRNGQTYVVQKVARGSVYIQEGDKLVTAKPDQVGLAPVKEFDPVFVSVRGLHVKTSYVTLAGSGSDINNEFHFNATFESPYFLREAFLVLELDMEHGTQRIFFQEIGDLLPGKARNVEVVIPLAEQLGSGKLQLHIFTEGREVFHSEQPWQFRENALDKMVLKRIEGEQDAPPRPLVGPVPEYPAALRKARVKGEAVVAVHLTRLGVVADPEVLRATDPAFGEAALVAVRQWRFLPRVQKGQPVEALVNVPFAFEAPAETAKP